MVGISYIRYTQDGNAFVIKREIPEGQLKAPDMGLLKQWFNCDTVLRNDGKLYFCDKIQDAEIIEK